ncbi:PASTA domain-containing protein OS=Cellulomonas persica OX=76861 GN=CPE01_00940 PE=4 SV=1 [Cellulomonas persica]
MPDAEAVYLVVDQDPIEGVVPVGTVITLTVEKKA